MKAGRLTEEQAQAMKQRLEADDFPLFGGPAFGHRGFGGHHGFRDLDAAATYLGVDEDALRERLRDGETLAEVAKAEGKSVDGLVTAIVAATTKRLDEAVAAGRITKAQRDEIVSNLKQRTTEIVNGTFPALKGREARVTVPVRASASAVPVAVTTGPTRLMPRFRAPGCASWRVWAARPLGYARPSPLHQHRQRPDPAPQSCQPTPRDRRVAIKSYEGVTR